MNLRFVVFVNNYLNLFLFQYCLLEYKVQSILLFYIGDENSRDEKKAILGDRDGAGYDVKASTASDQKERRPRAISQGLGGLRESFQRILGGYWGDGSS